LKLKRRAWLQEIPISGKDRTTAVTDIDEDTEDKNGRGSVRYTEGSTRGV
jgi:hypothetical protein